MRNLLVRLMAALVLISTASSLSGAQVLDQEPERQQVKARQKAERRALKLQQKYRKSSLKGQPLPKAERVRIKHQMQREQRDLRQRQKDEMQNLKDLQRVAKDWEKQY